MTLAALSPFTPNPNELRLKKLQVAAKANKEIAMTDAIEQPVIDKLVEALMKVISEIPSTDEKLSPDPSRTAKNLTNKAAAKSAAVSATLAIPPGPVGLLTVIPDLMVVWKIQRQLVVDIAAAYGKSAVVTPDQMIYCLFKHTAAQAVRDLAVRAGQRVVAKRASQRVIQQTLRKVGIRITQKAGGKAAARWFPIIGAVFVGAYSLLDTRGVGKTARRLYAADIQSGEEACEDEEPESFGD